MARWEQQDPVIAIDAQLDVLKAARGDLRMILPNAEELVVRAMATGSTAAVDEALQVLEDLRICSHDFPLEIDELPEERRQLLPGQRPPSRNS
jgi:hypothetical protein